MVNHRNIKSLHPLFNLVNHFDLSFHTPQRPRSFLFLLHLLESVDSTMVAPKDALCSAPRTGFDPERKNTPLQGHAAFFDKDGDGIIWPTDT